MCFGFRGGRGRVMGILVWRVEQDEDAGRGYKQMVDRC